MASPKAHLRLSVIINNYNYGQYIEECINSVLTQTRAADEIIFVDDGSTDNSLEIIQSYKGKVDIISKPNGGQLSAIIAGAEAATGDILLFLDSDDLWKNKHLEIVESTYNSTPELGCLFTSLELFGTNSGPHLSNERKHPSKIIESKLITQYLDQFLGRPTSASSFRRAPIKQVLTACKDLEKDFRTSADKVLSQGASLIGMSKLFIDERTVYYRTHASNAFYYSNRVSEKQMQERQRRNDLISHKMQLAFPFKQNAGAIVREMKKNQDSRLLDIFYKDIPKRMNLSKTSRKLLKRRLIIANTRLKGKHHHESHSTRRHDNMTNTNLKARPVRWIMNLLSKKQKVTCSPRASKITGRYKKLQKACKRYRVNLVDAKIAPNINATLNKTQPISNRLLSQIAIYPICAQANQNWAELNDDDKSNLLELWVPKLENMSRQYDSILENQKPDAVLIFQGYLPDDAILRQLAIQRDIPIIAIENTMRSDRLIWESISGITVNKNQAHLQFWKNQSIVSVKEAQESAGRYLSQIKDVKKPSEHSSPTRKYNWNADSKKILFLGQVYTDSSQLFGLGGFNNPIEVIGALLKWTEKNEYSLLIKLHPKEHEGNNPVTLTPYADITYRQIIEQHSDLLRKLGTRIYIDHQNEYDTYDLIEQCALVATVNSQAGLEAAIMGKAVIHGRQCFYGGLGFTHEYQDNLDIELRLDQALQEGPKNINDAKKFFHILFENYCIKKTSDAVALLLSSKL